MGSEIQKGVMRVQKREFKISRVTYLLIKNFVFFQEFLHLFSSFNRKH
jgi:hypothetical protein